MTSASHMLPLGFMISFVVSISYSAVVTVLYIVSKLELCKDKEVTLFINNEHELLLRKMRDIEEENTRLKEDNKSLVEQINLIGRNAT